MQTVLKINKPVYILVASLGILAYFFAVIIHTHGDLYIYELGSNDIVHGIDAYSKTYVDGYHYYYSALFAIVIYPLYLLPDYAGNFIWLILNVALLIRIVILCSRYFDLSAFGKKQSILFGVLCIAFALQFILLNLRLQQITIVILYLVLEGLYCIFSGKKMAGAALLALGINIKLLPLVILPYLLYRKEWQAFLYTIMFWLAMLFLPGLMLGFPQNDILINGWWKLINPTNAIHVVDVDERSFHGLSTLLATLLMDKVPDKYALPIHRNIANVTFTQLEYILTITRLVLISFTLYFLRTWPLAKSINRQHRFFEVSYLLLLVPLIFPHQQLYAFLFILPAVSCVIYYLITQREHISKLRFMVMVSFLSISYFTCNAQLLLGQFGDYYIHFKILTYGALIVIPLLAFSFPLKRAETLK